MHMCDVLKLNLPSLWSLSPILELQQMQHLPQRDNLHVLCRCHSQQRYKEKYQSTLYTDNFLHRRQHQEKRRQVYITSCQYTDCNCRLNIVVTLSLLPVGILPHALHLISQIVWQLPGHLVGQSVPVVVAPGVLVPNFLPVPHLYTHCKKKGKFMRYLLLDAISNLLSFFMNKL